MELIKVKWCKLRNYAERLENGLSFLASVVLSVHKEWSEMCVPKYKILFKQKCKNQRTTDCKPLHRYEHLNYAHDCKRRFYITYVLLFCTSEKKPMSVRPQNKYVH